MTGNDADDRMAARAQRERLRQNVRGAAELVLPERMTDDGRRIGASRAIVAGVNMPARSAGTPSTGKKPPETYSPST